MYLPKKQPKSPQNQQFIITPADAAPSAAVADALRQYPTVEVLDRLDAATVLVQMTEEERQHLARAHPELAIEPNILYQLF